LRAGKAVGNSAASVPAFLLRWSARGMCVLAMLFLSGCPQQPKGKELRLDSEPSGALLTLDGKDVGKTPVVLTDPAPGKYLLHLEKDGYESMDRIVELKEDTGPEVTTRLRPLSGLVLIESVPSAAEVSVDGAFRGKTPLFCTDLSMGKHKVSFTLEGYDPREAEIVINDRVPQLCQMSMKSNLATLRVESSPPGATVLLDGLKKGETPCVIDDVMLGKHDLKLLKEAYNEYQQQISVAQAHVIPVSVKLEEKLAAIEVSSTPADARVSIDGNMKGRTPLQITGLRDGSYKLTIDKPSYSSTNVVVEIQKLQDAKVDVTLDKSTGTLVLSVTPPNANIFVDGELKGTSGDKPLEIELPPGTYKVEVTKPPKHEPKSVKAQVEARKSTKVDIALRAIWVKDTRVILKDGRMREGMIVIKYPDGGIKIETSKGVFEEFTADEVKSTEAIKQ
jgi:hypothetical protein